MTTKLRDAIRQVLPEPIRRAVVRTGHLWASPDPFARTEDVATRIGSAGGVLLGSKYPGVRRPGFRSEALHAAECSVFSQHGEDGILAWLFDAIGIEGCNSVEFGCGNGRENCTANLLVNFGWSGSLIDANPANVAAARTWFGGVLGAERGRAVITEDYVTTDNVDRLVGRGAESGKLDLLSVDIDGVDYWVWKAIVSVQARAVVIEYNASCGPTNSVTVPYRPDFDLMAAHPSRMYHGASITALERLGRAKGYRLIGCDSSGVNAFFVRDDLPGPAARAPAIAWRPHAERAAICSQEEQWAAIRDLACVAVDE